jgi:initiation factor 1A
MVKNTTGGNKHKKQSRSVSTRFNPVDKLDQGQMFAQIMNAQGDSRFRVICSDGVIRIGRLSGHMRKGPRLANGTFIVISLREFEQDQKNCDILTLGNPPYDIVSIFRKNDTSQYKDDIEFVVSDDEFNEFNEISESRNRRFDMPVSDSDDEENEDDEGDKIKDQIKEQTQKIEVVHRKEKDIRAAKKIEDENEEIDWNDL